MARIDASRVLTAEQAKAMLRRKTDSVPATKTPYGTVIHDADTGAPVVALTRYAGDLESFREAVLQSPWNNNLRNSGMKNVACSIGFTTRKPLWRQFACQSCTFARDYPEIHATIENAAATAWQQISEILPEQAAHTTELASAVHDDWRMVGTPWTSGVVNLTSALDYHFDRNNFKGAWSAMIVVRRGARGGHLHLPEYDVALPCRDGDLLFFPASGLLHGVTPIDLEPNGYRITTVYYSLRAMKSCLPIKEEHERMAEYATDYVDNLLERQRKMGLLR